MDYWAGARITDYGIAGTRIEDWERIFAPHRENIKRILEVGSFEGQGALFWCQFFDATVDCIDNWANVRWPPTDEGAELAKAAEAAFDFNTANRPVNKIKSDSTAALYGMRARVGIYDLIYIDGDHFRLSVMADTCLAWPLLRSGGFMIWDDYREYCPGVVDRPTPAIDAFVMMMGEAMDVVADTGKQLIVQKR